MELTFWLIILGVYSLICFVISSFFEDREIGKWTVFFLSLLTTPIIGILIGLSSKRTEVSSQTTSSTPIRVSSSGMYKTNSQNEIKSYREKIVERLEQIKRLEGLELGSDELSEEKETLKEQYKSLTKLSKEEKPVGGDLTPEEWVTKMVSYLKERPKITPNHRIRIINSMDTIKTEDSELTYEVKDNGVLYTFFLEMDKIENSEYSRLKDFKLDRKIVK